MKTLTDEETRILVSALEEYLRLLDEQDRPHSRLESMILRKLKEW